MKTKLYASDYAKQEGLKSLAQITDITGVSVQTLNNWFNNKRDLFDIVVFGCVAYLRTTKQGEG